MRLTTVVRKLLGVTQLFVLGVKFDDAGLVIQVKPRWRRPLCGVCLERAPGYDTLDVRRWRHLALGRIRFWLEYAPRRVDCPSCGVVTEHVAWAAHLSRFTLEFEEMSTYLLQQMNRTAVTLLMGINWRTVGTIATRIVAERLDPDRLKKLYIIGVDEISFRRHHEYVTVVVDHAQHRVVWTGEGKGGDTLHLFFDELGEEGAKRLEAVTMDMSQAYIGVVQDRAPQARITFDRFHVQRLGCDAVDEVRRAEVRALAGTDEGKVLKKTRYALLKNPWNLTRKEGQRLRDVQRNNRGLYRAYLLNQTLAQTLDYVQPGRARKRLTEWIGWSRRSRLAPFIKLAATIERHMEGILAYVETRLTNGLTEGLNNKTRLITRIAYGFHSAQALGAMILLCCGGIVLDPPIPLPT